MSQEPPKNPIFYKKTEGLPERHSIRKILPGERLFIVENRKKGQRIATLFPDDAVISTEGIPLDIDIQYQHEGNPDIHYSIKLSAKGEKLATEIRKRINQTKIVYMLTDPNSRGEAIAQGLLDNIPELQGKTNRIRAKSLESKHLLTRIEQEGQLPPDRWGIPDSKKADSHWTRSVMDIAWKRKVNIWVNEAARIVRTLHDKEIPQKAQESLSRLQCAILHLLNNLEEIRGNYRGYKYWTVKARLMGSIHGSYFEAYIAVPNLLLLEDQTNPLIKCLWQEKLQKSTQHSREGISIPQQEPGNPWRFDTEVEAFRYRNNIKRYPLFTLETSEIWDEDIKPSPAHSTSTILEKAFQQKWGKQKEVAEVLQDLYLTGLITQVKTGSNNLSEESFNKLWKFSISEDIGLCRNRRTFHEDISNQEAIQPTIWEKTPIKVTAEIARSTKPTLVPLAERIYKEIYEQAIKSQFTKNSQRILQISAVGPLPSTAEDAFRGEPIQKESPLKSLMGAVLTGKIVNLERENPLFNLNKDSLLQVVKIWIEEHETKTPQGLNREELLLQMQTENLGRLETLTALIPRMEEAGLLEEKDGLINLTTTGKITIRLLNEYLGNFIHQKYHEVVESQLKEIEHGRSNSQKFLQYWWKSLCEVANNLPPIPEAIADSSGKTLQEIENRLLQNKKPPEQGPEFGIVA